MPDNPFSMVVNGEVAAILFGFRNTGDEVLRVVGVQGHFTQPGQYDKFIRNITRMPYLAEVQPVRFKCCRALILNLGRGNNR